MRTPKCILLCSQVLCTHTILFCTPRSQSSIFSHGGSFSWISHLRRRRHRQRQAGLRHRGAGQSAVELRRRPGEYELGAGVHLSRTAALQDAERRSVKDKLVQLWLKRLKNAALDISDMMEDYQDTNDRLTAKVRGSICLH